MSVQSSRLCVIQKIVGNLLACVKTYNRSHSNHGHSVLLEACWPRQWLALASMACISCCRAGEVDLYRFLSCHGS